jgi:phosphotransferase system HPr-like phosphotransfer protein/mannitol/fructose-specific phosphotransferase system IIA component (Ntr-type)
MIKITCKLNCQDSIFAWLHMRPATFLVNLCKSFPETQFRILKNSAEENATAESVNAQSIIDVVGAYFVHGETVTVEVIGMCQKMASEFFKVAWENLADYADNPATSKARLAGLIDETFIRIEDPDITEFDGAMLLKSEMEPIAEEECRSVATINDRLHNLSLPMIPLIAKFFGSRLQIAFEVPMKGVFCFTMDAQNGFQLESRIMELTVEVGTRITVLTWGPNRFKSNAAIKNVFQNLWQCDEWLRSRAKGLESEATIAELIEFADQIGRSQNSEYISIQNPTISNLLTLQQVFINEEMSDFSKGEVLSQLAAPHARMHGLELSSVLQRVEEAERREPVVLRDGFAIAHGAMDRSPRISIAFGVYPKGVVWDANGRIVKLVSMVVFAKDTYGTWRDYLRKMAILFRANPGLQNQLILSQNSEEFRTTLRQTESAMIK